MPVHIDCPNCKAPFDFADKYLGRNYTCRNCKHIFTINDPNIIDGAPFEIVHKPVVSDADVVDGSPFEVVEERSARSSSLREKRNKSSGLMKKKARKGSASSSQQKAALLIGAGVLLLAGVVVGIVLVFSGGKTEPKVAKGGQQIPDRQAPVKQKANPAAKAPISWSHSSGDSEAVVVQASRLPGFESAGGTACTTRSTRNTRVHRIGPSLE